MRRQHSSYRSFWWKLAALAWLFTGGAFHATAGAPTYEDGLRALNEGLPQAAAYKLRLFLQGNPAPAARRDAALALSRALLAVPDARAALAALDDAFPLPPTADDATDPEIAFQRAQTLAALDRWPEALENYTRAASAPDLPPGLAARARFGRGEALHALAAATGDNHLRADAAEVFKTLEDDPTLGPYARLRCAEIALDSHHLKEAVRALGDLSPGNFPPGGGNEAGDGVLAREHAYLVGRLRLAQRQPALAQRIFTAALTDPRGLSARLLVDNYWGWARACLDEDQPEQAQRALENLLNRYPDQPYLAASFNWLEAIYSRTTSSSLADLQQWAKDDDAREREALARLTLAHLDARQGRPERAEESLRSFGADFPGHPLCPRALLDLATLRLDLGRLTAARSALLQARRAADTSDRWRTGLEVIEARLSLAESDNAGAIERFETLATRLGTGPAAEAAAFNAALAALRSGDPARLADTRAAFTARFPRSAFAAEFPLEEGLARATQTTPNDAETRLRAVEKLDRFLSDHAGHPRAAEAHIALAELAFGQARPDIPAARGELAASGLLRVSNESPAPASTVERDRADYLAIWLADAPGPLRDTDKAIAMAKEFLAERADSPLAADVRMKLGEIYFAQGDYADAQSQLELLVEKTPGSPLVEAALYLAGQAAAGSMSAAGLDKAVKLFNQVELYDRASNRDGPFRLPARLRLAELKLGEPNAAGARDALILYDGVLSSTGGPTPLKDTDLEARCTALVGRGQALMALAAREPSLYQEAIRDFDQLATATPGASLRWRRQALTLKGKVFERLGDTDAALAAYDDALDATANAGSSSESSGEEWTWFYRAGSDAANLLENQSQWAAAIAVYKKLAAADGPMKSEFENTLAKQRLKHFLWED